MSPTPLQSPLAAKVLECLQFQGQRNDCGPFTTATIINALHGKGLDPIELAEKMNKPAWRGPLFVVRRVPNWATFPWGIVDVLREHGLNARWRLFTPASRLFEGLARGQVLMPIIGEWKPMWAHVMTLVAWDPERGWGFANTQYDHRQIDWHPDKRFRHQWRNLGQILIDVRQC
jgi:hypothetical protein